MATYREKLDIWENKLLSDVGEGDLLLGELGHSRQDLGKIGGLLASIFLYHHLNQKRHKFNITLKHVGNKWPLTLALYLVLEGIYHYESDELYWHGPKKQLGIQQNHTHLVGSLFLDTLAKYNLPTFEQSGGHSYVTPILLHGGIPNDHLGRFFDFLLRYEVEPHRIAVDAETLLTVWRRESDLTYLPKPAQRFLHHGGNVATDFVARCLELFNVTTEKEAFELDLPERVRKIYWDWQAQNEEELRKRPSHFLIRLQKPILKIAPHTEGVFLYLPPQQLPTRNAPKELVWQISSGDHIRRENTTRQRVEGGYNYSVAQDVFVWPESQYRIRLEADGEELKTWDIDGIEDPPLLIFEPYGDYEGDALNQDKRHQPGRRWLLYPQNFKLTTPGHKIRDLHGYGLAGNWQAFRLEEWELLPGQLKLTGGQSEVHSFTIVREQSRRPPRLTNNNRLQLSTIRVDFPLYNGRPPHLIVPTTHPHRWRVVVRAEGASQPAGYRHYRLSNLPSIQKDGEAWVDLAIPELLGDHPIGKFEIVARGPMGRSRNLGLRIVPYLEVSGHDTLYLAEAERPAHFQVTCDRKVCLRQSPPQEGVDIREKETTEDKRSYTIVAQSCVRQLSLQLDHDRGPKIPLTIPIHRLRWGIKIESGEETKWHTRPYSFYPDGLPSGAELRINVPLVADDLLRVGWRLINADGDVLRQVNPGELRVQRRMRISLTEVTAAWREYQEILCWQIIIQRENNEPPIIVDAFYLLPELNLGELAYQWKTEEEQIDLTLCWEWSQLGQRQLRLWPLDRPWEEPITRIIPKSADTIAEWQFNNKELPIEAYLAEVTAHNPWASQKPQRPERGQPNTLLIKPPGLDDHYTRLKALCDEGKATSAQLIALLIHQYYNGKENDMHQTNWQLAEQRASLSLTWLVRWAESARRLDRNAHRLVQYRIFDQPVVERLAQAGVDSSLLERYFEHLPDPRNRIIEKLYVWVLQSGLRGKRRHCLGSLCRLSLDSEERQHTFQVVMDALLEDVANGSLLVNEAVTLLHENAQEAAVYLAQDGGQDAAELLRYLTKKTELESNWCWIGMTLNTDAGEIVVRSLRHRQTAQPYYCTPLTTNCYADGELHNQDKFPLPVRLDLQNCLLHFDGYKPYQCLYCQQIYRDVSSYKNHHRQTHPDMPEKRKRIQRDLKLAYVYASIENEEET